MDRATYGLAEFVADLRAALRADLPEADRLDAGAAALRRWLANPDALADYRHALEVGRGPWLLYADPGLGFVVTLLRKTAGATTPVHHHGEAWTLYGIADGDELVHRYDRHDEGTQPGHADVRLAVDHPCRSGEVEIEPAYAIHNETTSAARDTIAIAVRGRDLTTIQQHWFDLEAGTVRTGAGHAAAPVPAPHR
jgi:predicted metal-dependent enzyme (double-stranded beta helix superfamily)